MTNKISLTLVAGLALSGSAQAQIAYSNDFETTTGGFTAGALVSHPNTANPAGATSQFLGLFSDNSSTSLTLSGLVPGDLYDLTLDLLVRGSWDGNNSSVGPDVWRVTAAGGPLVDTTFSNVSGSNQSFSSNGYIGVASYAPGTDAEFINTDVYGIYDGYALYKFDGVSNPQLEFTAASGTVILDFAGQNLQGVPDESWAIDNVVVSRRGNVIPEPGTLALVGLGALALLRRRRK
ncbi:PEP-CTERM sorting domain-containing protein [Armatimonas sp.]|uniref:PEP-CTERM sorting domain-containing protein n=1 Tax=Armatimonas sp. TaxID=1872638 RepID=UPI00286B904F|nr:PEP-CTERM sorting domain-containing protein [Armatimonas sp.]